GATAIYILKHLLEYRNCGFNEIHIYVKESRMETGMHYNLDYTDKYHLANISSEAIPVFIIPFSGWLGAQSTEVLNDLAINRAQINDKEVYSRIALGRYFYDQYTDILNKLKTSGTSIFEYPDTEILDISYEQENAVPRLY